MEPPKAPEPPTKVDLPMIRVEDWGYDPPHASFYMRGDNELDLKTIYIDIKTLTKHAGHGTVKPVVGPFAGGALPKYRSSFI